MTEPAALQPQDLVITLLGTYVRPYGARVWSGGLVALLGDFGFSDGAARVALTRLVRRGLLARERSGRLVHYRVTSRCDRLLAEGDGRIFSLGELGAVESDSDGWTVLWHQIPEQRRLERARLARRLRFLGFGSMQDSVWVSPHDHSVEVGALLDELGVSDSAVLFVARLGFDQGLAAMVDRAWDLIGLAALYEAFDAQFSPYRRRGVRLDDREAFLVRTRLIHMFRGFPALDPELPEGAPAAGAPGVSRARARAVRTFQVLYERLAPASQRHFESVTGAWRPQG